LQRNSGLDSFVLELPSGYNQGKLLFSLLGLDCQIQAKLAQDGLNSAQTSAGFDNPAGA
jgi:hypothetical protein